MRQLGRSGFGFICLAQDTLLGEDVAIKELIPALAVFGCCIVHWPWGGWPGGESPYPIAATMASAISWVPTAVGSSRLYFKS